MAQSSAVVADHLRVAAAGGDLLAHDAAQVAGELGVAVLDGLVLAHHAAQLAPQRLGAGFEARVAEAVGRVADGGQRRGGEEEQEEEGREGTAKCSLPRHAGEGTWPHRPAITRIA